MICESKYRIVLLDEDRCEISDRESDNLKEAVAKAKYLMSDDYARSCEANEEAGDASLNWCKCEVRSRAGEVIRIGFHRSTSVR